MRAPLPRSGQSDGPCPRVPSAADPPYARLPIDRESWHEYEGTCSVCFQPECPESTGGIRPQPGSATPRPERGNSQFFGYGDWAMHPLDAIELLHRGYALVDGRRSRVRMQFNLAYAAIVHIELTNNNAAANAWSRAA